MTSPRIIAIASQKGGVAKTTTCLSLGACLAESGRSVLMIDLDPQAHLTLSLGIRPESLRHTARDAILANRTLVGVTRETDVPLLDLAPANQGLNALDKLLYNRPEYEYLLKRRFEASGGDYYDVILIDCPPSFGTLMLNALTAADLVIVPTQCEYYASRALRHVLQLVQLVRQKSNSALAYRVLITMFDRRNRISHFVREQLAQSFPGALFETIIEVDTKLRESPVVGQPITRYAPHTRGAEQYRALAQELMNHA
jgi:chromosome partitioning protein